MTRTELARASELLSEASGNADGETAERLSDFAGQLDDLAERERGPDHGRMARILTALDGIADEVDEATAATVQEARDEITAYREGVEGV